MAGPGAGLTDHHQAIDAGHSAFPGFSPEPICTRPRNDPQ